VNAPELFLSDPELAKLTGFKIKSKQIVRLRAQGIAFRVNASGHPVVTRAAVEGRKEPAAAQDSWTPGLVGA
jgi:hypothetical protein